MLPHIKVDLGKSLSEIGISILVAPHPRSPLVGRFDVPWDSVRGESLMILFIVGDVRQESLDYLSHIPNVIQQRC
jgi:hypothetical protein